MIDVETAIEPPGLDDINDDDGGDMPRIGLFLSLHEADGTTRSTELFIPDDASDATIADGLMRLLPALAALRGPGLVRAIAQRLRGSR